VIGRVRVISVFSPSPALRERVGVRVLEREREPAIVPADY